MAAKKKKKKRKPLSIALLSKRVRRLEVLTGHKYTNKKSREKEYLRKEGLL